ncbi:methyltransferase domain-containing protein [Paraburkholderia unamae]|uniref:O-antigen chain-terminating methyltransferase n=1 Tax=Paraburkholderia unamae TaxID=219649 RepID=A0ABX5KK70_9BURK|nr:methyltransferase domain-containing protein [Paraburkholderia unamae]PVX82157.1 O-antigen chain-terminating methyltransferase [Paraburkholderia unamae]
MTSAVLNDLIARVKAEAAVHAQRAEAAQPGGSPHAHAQAPAHGAHAPAPVSLGDDPFMIGTDDEFIDSVYRRVLHREADDSGRANYRKQLAAGGSRLAITGKLRLSAEGRRAGVPLGRVKQGVAAALVQIGLGKLGLGALGAALTRRMDARATSAELVQVGPTLYRHAKYLEQHARHLERRLQQHDAALAGHGQRIDELQALVTPVPPVPPEVIDEYYLAFEDANRGSREEILKKLSIYDSWVGQRVVSREGLKHDVVDVGCGRGEWLSFVRDRGKSAIGVDANRVMTDSCLKDGLNARCVDALTFLRSLPTGSVGAVTGFHIIEHLPFDYLYAVVQECHRVLAEGGSVLFETPNPENVLVGSHTFYHDFTHRNPVTPTAISFLLKHHGFGDIDIIRSSPYPHEAKVPGDDPLTERVNGHLCGPQDYAVTGTKGAPQEADA